MRKGFLLKLTAIALGVYAGLWFASGDIKATEPTFSGTLVVEDSFSFQSNIKVIELRFADGTALTIMGSQNVPLMNRLLNLDKEKVELSVRTVELKRLER